MRLQADVNRFVLDYLRHGPVRLRDAGTGTRYVAVQDNFVAIWWARPRFFRQQLIGGSAA